MGGEITRSVLQQLGDLSIISGEKPVFVNWYSNSTSLYLNGKIVIAIFRLEQSIKAVPLSIQLWKVNRLVK